MKKVCAWCSKDLGTAADEKHDENAISHGICRDCIDKYFGPTKMKLNEFLDKIAAPVVVIGENSEITSANTRAQKYVNKEFSEMQGQQPGDIFECLYAQHDEGCGNTVHCSGCTLRNTIMDTHETGKSNIKVPATLNKSYEHDSKNIEMYISTEKVKDLVLLRIDKINE